MSRKDSSLAFEELDLLPAALPAKEKNRKEIECPPSKVKIKECTSVVIRGTLTVSF